MGLPIFRWESFSPHFRTILTLLLLFNYLCITHAQSTPAVVQRVMFTRWAGTPGKWTRYDPDSLQIRWGTFIINRDAPPPFRFSFLSGGFVYTFSAPPGSYQLELGLMEPAGCQPTKRIAIYRINGVATVPVDIADKVGCLKPYYLKLPVTVPTSGLIKITSSKFGVSFAPLISNFILTAQSSSSTPPVSTPPETSAQPPITTPATPTPPPVSPSPTSSPTNSGDPDDVYTVVNAGKQNEAPGITSYTYSGPFDRSRALGVPPASFRTGIEGSNISFSYDLPSGSYDVTFGFIETNPANCQPDARVFHILINGYMRLESYDIFEAAGGCNNAIRERFVEQVIDGINIQRFTIDLIAVAGLASLSYFRIEASSKQCKPAGAVDGSSSKEDHFAHAVPGTYPSGGDPYYVDRSGKGFVAVKINGDGSHTHYSDILNGITGRLKLYRWVNSETGKLISRGQQFWYNFPLGTTRLTLTVVDNACTRDEAETSVTVIKSVVRGVYCYYYQGLTEHPTGGSLFSSPDPSFAKSSKTLRFNFPPLPFRKRGLTARCIFYYKFNAPSAETEISVITGKSGHAYVYSDADLILDTSTTYRTTLYSTPEGLKPFEVIYRHTDFSKSPMMYFRINGSVATRVFYDNSRTRPILSSVFPRSTGIEGGIEVTIKGIGLSSDVKVYFGSKVATIVTDTSNSMQVVVPTTDTAGTVDVYTENAVGERSNVLQFEYDAVCDPVKFSSSKLTQNGKTFKLASLSASTIWQDGKLYTGSIDGKVRAIDYDPETFEVRSVCHSEAVTDDRYENTRRNGPAVRFILGLAFDPRVSVPMPYLSTSTPFWGRNRFVYKRTPRLWSNGAVVRLKPASASTRAKDPNQCLEFDKVIVNNIPVGNSDHAVNELLFTDDGNLLVSVGGNTNAGLPIGKFGGDWDGYFGAAVISAHVSRRNYNGTIVYSTPDNLRTAKPMTDDVELYATGLRNMFAMTMTREGRIYGLDMGPNCGFGEAASACDEYDEESWASSKPLLFNQSFPGRGFMGRPGLKPGDSCYVSDGRLDKLVEIKAGKYYGHPNLPRGQMLGEPGECKWIDVLSGRSVKPFRERPPSNYEKPLTTMQSPATGIREYGANHFCGALRGNLITSMMKGRFTFRVPLKQDGSLDSDPQVIAKGQGGLKLDEDALGNLVFSAYSPERTIEILKPIVSTTSGLRIINAVPFFHGAKGGTVVVIGGSGFTSGTSVLIAGQPCPIVKHNSERLISCRVPPNPSASQSASIRISVNGASASLSNAILYTSV